jgi:hypothetical protein
LGAQHCDQLYFSMENDCSGHDPLQNHLCLHTQKQFVVPCRSAQAPKLIGFCFCNRPSPSVLPSDGCSEIRLPKRHDHGAPLCDGEITYQLAVPVPYCLTMLHLSIWLYRLWGKRKDMSRSALGPTQTPISWALGSLSPGSKRSERELTHLHIVLRLRMRGTMPPLPHTSSWHGAYISIKYIFMALNLLKHRDNFTIYLSDLFHFCFPTKLRLYFSTFRCVLLVQPIPSSMI